MARDKEVSLDRQDNALAYHLNDVLHSVRHVDDVGERLSLLLLAALVLIKQYPSELTYWGIKTKLDKLWKDAERFYNYIPPW